MKVTENDYLLVKNYCSSWKTLPQIIELLGLAETTVRRIMANMENSGFIIKQKTAVKGLPCFYLTAPKVEDEAIIKRFTRAKKPLKQKEVKQEAEKSYITKVNSDDYHTRIERVRPRVYVGGTANMV